MRRQMQANEIRTNIVYEFTVAGESNVRELHSKIMKLSNNLIKEDVNARLIGVSLKKPTATAIYLTDLGLVVDPESDVKKLASDGTINEGVDGTNEDGGLLTNESLIGSVRKASSEETDTDDDEKGETEND